MSATDLVLGATSNVIWWQAHTRADVAHWQAHIRSDVAHWQAHTRADVTYWQAHTRADDSSTRVLLQLYRGKKDGKKNHAPGEEALDGELIELCATTFGVFQADVAMTAYLQRCVTSSV
jgi:hypothetical protein